MLEPEERSFRSLGIAVNSMKYASPATRRFLQHMQSWSSGQQVNLLGKSSAKKARFQF